MFDFLGTTVASTGSTGASSGVAPGKVNRSQGLPPSATPSQGMTPLPPDLVETLNDGTTSEIVDALKKYPPGKGVLDTALAYLRMHRGQFLTEKVAAGLVPGTQLFDLFEGDRADRDEYLNSSVCHTDTPEVDTDHEFVGIELYIRVPEDRLAKMDRMGQAHQFGPGLAGPYKLLPALRAGRLLGYIAHHSKRNQNEWMIGPDSIDAFVSSVAMYAGAATTLLPGAPVVPSSMADGADKPYTPTSVVEDEAFGNAPWQVALGMGEVVAGETHGGVAAVGAINAAKRLGEYVKPAKDMAARILADVESGKVNHLDGRDAAINGRNQLLTDTRASISPGARGASKAMKEEGPTASDLEGKKTRELIKNYQGKGKGGKPLAPTDADRIRAALDADSPSWGSYARALEKDPDLMGQALATLGKSKEVSKAIIRSAGRPNAKVTAFAKLNVGVGGAMAAAGIGEMVYEIVSADEGDRLHVAAHDLAGFAGGVLGAEGTVWFASMLLAGGTGVGVPTMLVVSVLASLTGGMIGSHVGAGMADLLMEAGPAMAPGAAFGAAGGMSGLYDRGTPHGKPMADRAAQVIFDLDEELRAYDQSIHGARSEAELVELQRKRIDLLQQRSDYEDLLIAIKVGIFDEEVNESRPFVELPPLPPNHPEIGDKLDFGEGYELAMPAWVQYHGRKFMVERESYGVRNSALGLNGTDGRMEDLIYKGMVEIGLQGRFAHDFKKRRGYEPELLNFDDPAVRSAHPWAETWLRDMRKHRNSLKDYSIDLGSQED